MFGKAYAFCAAQDGATQRHGVALKGQKLGATDERSNCAGAGLFADEQAMNRFDRRVSGGKRDEYVEFLHAALLV
jgi:hypothetical protein